MATRVWTKTNDGKFEFITLSKGTLEGAMDVMRKAFFIDENVAIAIELDKHPNAVKELEEMGYWSAKDGCSIIAVECETRKVVGVAMNKLEVPRKPGEEHVYLKNLKSKCTEPSAKSMVDFMLDIDEEFDLFEHCKVDCILELMFVATLPEFRGRGIGRLLFESSIDFARALLNGENLKVSMDECALSLEPVPKIVSALNTSFITQKICKSFGFEVPARIPFERWSFNGKTYAERIGPETGFLTIEYLKL